MEHNRLLRRRVAVLLIVAGLLAALRPGLALGAPAAILRFQPTFVQARPGQTVRLEVWVDGAANLARLEFAASYDLAVLEPIDADPGREGVQIEVGPVFSDGYIPHNQADGGTMRLVAHRFLPTHGSFSGQGIVAAVTFRVRDEAPPGSYPLHFDPASLRLLDPDEQPLAMGGPTDGLVRVPPVTTALQGWITREGTFDHRRTAVTAVFYSAALSQPPLNWTRACTNQTGDFLLPVPEGEATVPPDLYLPDTPPPGPYEWAFVRLDFPNYLSECYWEPLDDEVVNIGWRVLEGGDVNGDGCVNIFDIVRIIADFGESVPTPCFVPYAPCPDSGPAGQAAPPSDVNGDCGTNIFDLTMASENFGLCSNCP
ncbi:MAG TPA: hypothetical protein ENI39_07025 [Anaerolineae bacterium]|nr:hypothetical protein [Anaerolineae bacterium]